MNAPTFEIVEVAPRDGFQAIRTFVPTKRKLALIEALYASGLRRFELTSFVNPASVPQMADAAELLAATRHLTGMDAAVLVPSLRQTERALAAGAQHLVFVLSVSESHNRSNVKRTPAQSVSEFAQVAARIPKGTRLRLNLATAFDCPFEGKVQCDAVLQLLESLVPAAPWAEIALCDTTGRAVPSQVAALFSLVKAQFKCVENWAFHGHDTYGQGIANVLAAWQSGVSVIDASAAGLGGCPFAPGASGNVATEDVVWTMEHMGISTGVDVEMLCKAAAQLVALPDAQAGGRVRDALLGRGHAALA